MLKNEGQGAFEEQILNLRALKYGRMLVKTIQEELHLYSKVYVERVRQEGCQSIVKFSIVGVSEEVAEVVISQEVSKAPLSNYEISPIISFQDTIAGDDRWYSYSITNSHSYMRDVGYNDPQARVLSPIKVDLLEKDYD